MIQNLKNAIAHPDLILPFLARKFSNYKISKKKTNIAPNPKTIKLILNSVCNCSCPFCDVGAKNRTSFYNQMISENNSLLSLELLNTLLYEFKHIKPFINICGVEPLLHPDIIEILKKLKQKGFQTTLITNGVLLPKYADQIARIGIRSLKVSIDGPAELHDSFRGNGVYSKVVQGLKFLNESKKKYKSKIKVVLNYTISNLNTDFIESVASYFLDSELVQEVKFNYLFFTTPEASKLQNLNFPELGKTSATNFHEKFIHSVDTDEIANQIKHIQEKYKGKIIVNKWLTTKHRLNTYYNSPNEKLGEFTCNEPWLGSTILSNGDVVISNRCFEYKTGNINDEPFKQIWNNEKSQKFRQQLLKAGSFPACNRCGGIFYS